MAARYTRASVVTLALITQRYFTESTHPKDVLGILGYILTNRGNLEGLANSTTLSTENVTSILVAFYHCVQNKTAANKTTEVWSCFEFQQTAKPAEACSEADVYALNTFIFFILGTLVLISLSFARVRKSCLLRCCFGRPGCVVPLNMLDSYENRFGNALAFGAATTRCCLIVLGENQALLGKEWAAYLDNPSTPSSLGVIAKIVITVMVATSYYPLFACMVWDNKVLGSILGAIYTLFWLAAIWARLVYAGACLGGSVKFIAFMVGYESPGVICLILLFCKFIYVLQGSIRQWYNLRKIGADISKMTYDEMYSNWRELYMYKHVCRLLKGSKEFCGDEDEERLKLKDKLKKKVYNFKPDFKYSTRVICAVFVGSYAAYVIAVACAYTWYAFTSLILKTFIYSNDFVRLLDGNMELVTELRQLFDVVYISFYVAICCACVVIGIVIMNMLSWYRGHIIRLRKGDRSWLPSSVRKNCISPASLTAASMKFAGFQVGYCVWGFVMLTIVFWVILSVIGTQLILPITTKKLSYLLSVLIKAWPAVFLTIVINILQVLLAKFAFLHDRGMSLSIKNRNAFHVASFYLFFFNIALGLVSCLLRIGYSVVFGVVFLARLQKSLLARSFEKRDPGYMAYVGYIFLEHSHANPVVCVFVTLLAEHCHTLKQLTIGKEEGKSTQESYKLRNFSESEKEDATLKRKRRLLNRNRWHVAVTLLRNPSLTKHRSPMRKMTTVKHLMKGLMVSGDEVKA